MTAAVWLLAAAVVLALPVRCVTTRPRHGRVRPAADGSSRGSADGSSRRVAAYSLIGAVSLAGVASVTVLGPVPGAQAAAVVCPALWLGLDRLRRRPPRRADDPRLPLALDLAAAGLRAGCPLADALARAAPAAGTLAAQELQRVAGLLRLGSEPEQAWGLVRGGPLGAVAAVAVRSAVSGIRVAGAFEELADELRAGRGAAAAVRAHQAGVRAMAPLAACFLPSFLCLGVVPVVVGIARRALDVVP